MKSVKEKTHKKMFFIDGNILLIFMINTYIIGRYSVTKIKVKKIEPYRQTA